MRKLITFILLILLFNPFGLLSPFFKFTGSFFTDLLLKHYGQTTKAIIIDEINYTNPASRTFGVSHSYLFKVDGKKYKNDPEDTTLKIGDTVQVEYYKNDPSVNKPLHPKQ